MIICCFQNTAFCSAESIDNKHAFAKIETATEVHDWLPQPPVNKDTSTKKISVNTGDIFKGIVELAEPHHNPAELTLYIRNATKRDSTESEFEIEATAVMQISAMRTTYGLHGFYDPDCQQMNLYEIGDPPASLTVPRGIVINGAIFEPVGLAGKFTDDGNTIQCAIAYNGNASLSRMAKTSYKLAATIMPTSKMRTRHVSDSKQFEN